MDIQSYIAFAIVGVAAFFSVRTFVRQFTRKDKKTCDGCVNCSPGESQPVDSHIHVPIEDIG